MIITRNSNKTITIMKKLTLSFFAVILMTTFSFAQKIGYIDSEYILSNIPEYKAAQAEMDKISVDWQKEIEAKYAEIDKLYKKSFIIFRSEAIN